MINAIKIEQLDNVVVAIEYIKAGEDVNYLDGDNQITFKSKDDVRIYHKIANKNILKGEHVMKYAEHIGLASRDIEKGEHVHTHNVEDSRENLKDKEE